MNNENLKTITASLEKTIANIIDTVNVSIISSIDESDFPNTKACVYFFDQKFFKGVMLTGTMEVLHDDNSKQMIWREGDEIYYPAGVTDSDYCVLKFSAINGRYYSDFKSESFEIK